MSWRPAKSLEVLKGQLDTTYPGWTFLGFKGDAAHAAVPSDHNENSAGVVCALDIGPGGGLDIHKLADNLAASPHPDCKYIISNRRIAEWQNGFKWQPYSGIDPHDTHIHISVGRGPDGQSTQPYDDTNLWNIKGEEMVTKEIMDALWPLITYEGHGPYQPDYDAWVGKEDLHTLIVYKIIPELRNHATVNWGDVVNALEPLLGHRPTDADRQAHVGESHKKFLYDKIIPEIKNRIK